MELTQDLVKSLFDYHEDGYLIWKVNIGSRAKQGEIAGWQTPGHRRMVRYNKANYNTSIIIFLWHKGWRPPVVDHKDRNPLNDKIGNLRGATDSENNKNRTKGQNLTSKYKGVRFKKNGWYEANIQSNYKSLYLGIFKTEEEAAIAYNEAAKVHHGEFANLNIIQTNNENTFHSNNDKAEGLHGQLEIF